MNSTWEGAAPEQAERQLNSELSIDNGTTAFMFLATSLVQFMTPGLGFFYAGMIGKSSVVQVVYQSFVCLGIIFCIWVICGFSMTFGEPWLNIGGYNLLGKPSTYFMLRNVHIYEPLQRASTIVASGFPGMLFMAYQGMFAVISPALISGAFVDRMQFGVYIVYITVWLIVVYAPLGYWNWGGGWMFQIGAWDFAGGMVVHESAGFSALGTLLVLGNRVKARRMDPEPHSIPFVVLGVAMLWFGWFGFNGGSALTIGGLATIAFVNSQIAPASGMVTWMALDQYYKGKPSLMGACSGTIAGLVVITPGAGFMQPGNAMLSGILGSLLCYHAVILVRKHFDIDDTCDTVGVHGVGGFLGTILVGLLSDPPDCQSQDPPEWCANPGTVARSFSQLRIQAVCGVFAAVFSIVMSYIITKVIYLFATPLVTFELQEMARDGPCFGEEAYKFPPQMATPRSSPDAEQPSGKQVSEMELEGYTSEEPESEEELQDAPVTTSSRVLLLAQSLFSQ